MTYFNVKTVTILFAILSATSVLEVYGLTTSRSMVWIWIADCVCFVNEEYKSVILGFGAAIQILFESIMYYILSKCCTYVLT